LIDRKALKGQDQLTYDILDWSLGDDASELKPGIADRFRLLPLNQFNGAQISFAREAQERDAAPFNQPRDYDNAIRRMLGFSRWLDQAIANMREGLKQGVTEPRAVVERMIAQVDTIAGGDPELSVFMRPAKNVPNRIAAADRARVVESYRAAVSGELIPAYRRLAEFLKTEYSPHARENPGLAAIPGGREMYLYLVKSETTTDLSPEAIHALGLEEIARIETEMEAVKRAAGFPGSLDAFRPIFEDRRQVQIQGRGRDESQVHPRQRRGARASRYSVFSQAQGANDIPIPRGLRGSRQARCGVHAGVR